MYRWIRMNVYPLLTWDRNVCLLCKTKEHRRGSMECHVSPISPCDDFSRYSWSRTDNLPEVPIRTTAQVLSLIPLYQVTAVVNSSITEETRKR